MSSASSASRLVHFDIAKGLAMFMIILTHMDSHLLISVTMPAHIPVFYFISGYFLSRKRTFRQTVRNKFHALVLPYFWICLLYLILLTIKNIASGTSDWMQASWQALIGALYGAGNDVSVPFSVAKIGAVWFLLANYWGLLLTRWAADRMPERLVIVLAAAWLSIATIDICWLPFSLQPGATASLYIMAGYLYRHTCHFHLQTDTPSCKAAMAAAVLIWICTAISFKGFYLVRSRFGGGVLDLLGSFCIIFAVFVISAYMARHPLGGISALSAWTGRHSLIVLGVHFLELRLIPWQQLAAGIPVIASSHMLYLLSVFSAKLLLDISAAWCFVCLQKKFRQLHGRS